MAATTCVNGQTVVHRTSEGTVVTTPDVCNTPAGPSVVPTPYTNMAVSKDTTNGSVSVSVDGNPIMLKESSFFKSIGDEAGTAKGLCSGTTCGEAVFQNYSFDVKVEGRNVCRRLDPMTSNNGNTPPAPLLQPNLAPEDWSQGQEGKTSLPIAFVNLHPDEISGRTVQPVFRTLHELRGPESHRHETEGYVGARHLCDRSDVDYELIFDDFHLDEDSFE